MPSSTQESPISSYHQLLVLVDGSPPSEKALDEAIRLARLNGARLRLGHVVDEMGYVNGFESLELHEPV